MNSTLGSVVPFAMFRLCVGILDSQGHIFQATFVNELVARVDNGRTLTGPKKINFWIGKGWQVFFSQGLAAPLKILST